MATKTTITVAGKSVDMDKLEEVAQLQAIILPDSWPISKRDGVRLFLNLQEMVAHELKRHLAHNFSKIVKTAMEQQAENEGAEVSVGFAFTINLSALTVAALGKTKMSFSHKFSTEGKAKAHDISQGDFLDNMENALDTGSLDAETAPEKKEEPKDGEPPADPTAGEEQGHKKKKGGKKSAK
jgi:hypothetical protein